MVFSSIFFIFYFLIIIIGIYFCVPREWRNFVLLIGSLIFYAWGEPVYVLLMIFSILFNYIFTLIMDKRSGILKKIIFTSIIIFNLFLLGFFKYYGFLIENINSIFSLSLSYRQLTLPIGISFYTFQILSYVIDVYLKKVNVQKNIINFALYVSLFPQLIAGPILKYKDVEKQLQTRKESLYKFGVGTERFIFGLAKKVILANNIGFLWNQVQALDIKEISVLTSWIGIIACSLQVYFDFSGYSDMAIGLGKMFGFDFDENFNYPYNAKSISEFWRRWHISLGGWFREYVYIPLGGNKKGIKRQSFNLLVVWFLTGLWHGASWNFVIWGLYYGFILFLEKMFLIKLLKNMPNVVKHIYTLIFLIIGWVFFAFESLSQGLNYLSIMFGFGGASIVDSRFLYYLSTNMMILIIGVICATPLMKKAYLIVKDYMIKKLDFGFVFVEIFVLIVSISYIVNSSYNPFLYFRF